MAPNLNCLPTLPPAETSFSQVSSSQVFSPDLLPLLSQHRCKHLVQTAVRRAAKGTSHQLLQSPPPAPGCLFSWHPRPGPWSWVSCAPRDVTGLRQQPRVSKKRVSVSPRKFGAQIILRTGWTDNELVKAVVKGREWPTNEGKPGSTVARTGSQTGADPRAFGGASSELLS